MQRDDNICRVLIVDDELEYATKVAETLEDVFRDSRHEANLQIELTNTAAFAAARLDACDPEDPPWDVILADLFMPRSASSPTGPIDPSATRNQRSSAKGCWPCWEYRYTYNSRTPHIDNGGLYLARKIADRAAEGRSVGKLKLVLISRHLEGTDRRSLHEFREHHRDWLDYFDKTSWEEGESWDKDLAQGVFQWALTQAIRDRNRVSWGDSVLDLIPDGDYFAHVSNQIDRVLVEARVRAEDRANEVVLVTGEAGVGRRALAGLVHAIRNVANPDAPFSPLDAWATPADRVQADLFGDATGGAAGPRMQDGVADTAAGGTLLVHELGKIPPYVQGGLLGLIEDGCFRRSRGTESIPFRGSCVVFTGEDDLEHQVDVGVLDHRLRDRLAVGRIRIPPLRERPNDIVPLARQALKHADTAKILTPESMEWLQDGNYRGNTRELFQLIRGAALASPTSEITVGSLELLTHGRPHRLKKPLAARLECPSPDPPNLLVRESRDLWRFRFRGGDVVPVTHRDGFAGVGLLLAAPHRRITIDALDAEKPRPWGPSDVPSRWALDEASVDSTAYKHRPPSANADVLQLITQRRYLEGELERAKRDNDEGRVSDANEAIGANENELAGHDLSSVLALQRKAAKRQRGRVWARIKRVCKHLENSSDGSGSHIIDAIKPRSDGFAYCPDDNTVWLVDC